MIRDVFVGLVLIVYTFSLIGCYELTVAAMLDAVEHYDAALSETFDFSPQERLAILLFSAIPVINTVMAILVWRHYEEFVAMITEGVAEGREEMGTDDESITEQVEPSTEDSL